MDDECSKAARRKFMGTSNGARLIKATRSRIDLERVMMEPLVRFELTTVRLQGGCSTTELKRHGNEVAHIYRRWPMVASRKWGGRHGAPHFNRFRSQTGSPVPAADRQAVPPNVGLFQDAAFPRRGRVSLPSVPLLRKERLLALPFPHFRTWPEA